MQQLLDKPIPPVTKVIYQPNYFKIFSTDPRPDLFDADIWAKFLPKITRNHVESFFHLQALSCLWHVRTIGTILKWDMHQCYRLKALIGFGNWENLEYWEDTKQRHLMQYKDIYSKWFYLIDHD